MLTPNPTINVPSGLRSLKTIDLRYMNANPDKIKAQAHAPPLTLPPPPPSPPLLPPLKNGGLKRRPTGMEQRSKGTTTQKSQNADDTRLAKGRVKVALARTRPSAGTHRKDITASAPTSRPRREATPAPGSPGSAPSGLRGSKREVKWEPKWVRERGGLRGTEI